MLKGNTLIGLGYMLVYEIVYYYNVEAMHRYHKANLYCMTNKLISYIFHKQSLQFGSHGSNGQTAPQHVGKACGRGVEGVTRINNVLMISSVMGMLISQRHVLIILSVRFTFVE